MIKGPKNATPTTRGWVSPKGELLKAQKISQAQLDEYFGVQAKPAPAPVVEEAPVVVEEEVTIDELIADPVEENDEIEINQVLKPETKVRPTRKSLAERLRKK